MGKKNYRPHRARHTAPLLCECPAITRDRYGVCVACAPEEYTAIVSVIASPPPEASPEDREDHARARQAEVGRWAAEDCRRSLLAFVRAMWPVLRGAQKLAVAPHVEALCEEAQAIAEGWLLANERVDLARNRYQEMLERARARWRAHGIDYVPGEMLVQNEVVNIAPSTLKSLIWMVFLPAWVWLHDPTCGFGCASVSDANVQRDARECRDLVTDKRYREAFGIRWDVRDDTTAVGRWLLDAGGSRVSRTMMSGFVGQHVDIMLIDDPDDSKRVWSDSARTGTHEQFSTQMENRVNHEPLCLRVIIQQRVHVEDLSGYLLAKKRWSPANRLGWAWFCAPVTWGKQPEDAPEVTPHGVSARMGRSKGELLKRFTRRMLDDKLTTLEEIGVNAQYEQNPKPLDGGLLKRHAAKWWVPEGTRMSGMRRRPEGCVPREELPPVIVNLRADGTLDFESAVISVDCSNGSVSKTASYVGLTVWGLRGRGAERYWLDDDSRVMESDQQHDAVEAMIVKWSASCDEVLIEQKALGASVTQRLLKKMAEGKLRDARGKAISVAVVEIKVPSGAPKLVRGRAMSPSWRNGQWYVLDGAPWVYARPDVGDEGAIADVCGFPHAKRADRIDTLSQLAAHCDVDPKARDVARALAMCVA